MRILFFKICIIFKEKLRKSALLILEKQIQRRRLMVVNRIEVLRKCDNLQDINKVIANMLSDVNGEIVTEYYDIEVDTELVSKERNALINGDFGSEQHDTNEEEFIPSLVNDFFSSSEPKKNYIMHMSSEVLGEVEYMGEVFAIGREDTASYYGLEKNISMSEHADNGLCNSVGLIVSNENYAKLLNESVDIEGYDFFGTYINEEWLFYRADKKRSYMSLMMFDLVTNLYSRNTGLLESKIMLQKKVLIVGAGSVGSFIALELARAGVGQFVLCDRDILEIHNVCRHQLGWKDIGRYKVDAVKDAIMNINPTAKVEVYHGYLQELPEEYVDSINIIIGTGDNREANAFANDLAYVLRVPFVTAGCWQRAHAGEVFYWYPESGLPLYRKAFEKLISEDRAAAHANYFVDTEDEKHINFEPGVSSDIEFVTLVAVKLIYDLLNKGEEGYTLRVLDYLKNYTLVCNTNKACIGGESAEMFPNPLFISNNVVVGG